MRNPQNILITILLFLLLASLGGIYYINKKYEDAKNEGLKKIKVVVAEKNISQAQPIGEKDIKTVEMAKAAVTFRPLHQEEIVGRYAKTPIFAGEPIIQEKITPKLHAATDANLTAMFDKFNIRFTLFQNPNYNLKKGERIDIIGVYKNNVDPSDNNFMVGYAARNIKILDFLKNGHPQAAPAIKNEQPQQDPKNKKEKKPQPIIFADELVLDMRGEEIGKTLSIINKNHQIWMVLSNENRGDEALDKIKNGLILSNLPLSRQAQKEPSQTAPQSGSTAAPKPKGPAVIYETDGSK